MKQWCFMLVLKVLLLQVAVIMFNSFLFSHSVLYWFFFLKKKKSHFTYKKKRVFIFLVLSYFYFYIVWLGNCKCLMWAFGVWVGLLWFVLDWAWRNCCLWIWNSGGFHLVEVDQWMYHSAMVFHLHC